MLRLSVAAVAAAFASACIPVTVNLTFAFPPKEMEQKLVEMEKKVREAEKPKSPAPAFEPVAAVDQDPQVNITVETPAIKEINERRKKRSGDLSGHFGAGRIGEAKNALVAERELGDMPGKDKAALRKLVKEENEDREKLLSEILKANKLAADQLDNVRTIYARALRKVSSVGWWIETPKGNWLKKTEEHQKKLEKDEEID